MDQFPAPVPETVSAYVPVDVKVTVALLLPTICPTLARAQHAGESRSAEAAARPARPLAERQPSVRQRLARHFPSRATISAASITCRNSASGSAPCTGRWFTMNDGVTRTPQVVGELRGPGDPRVRQPAA